MAPEKAPLEFPCKFPIKAMGLAEHEIGAIVAEIVGRHAPDVYPAAVRTRPSREGRYVSVTVTINATSREQLDAIYQELTACEQILVVL
jgi:putative lipoic acid-binding regulatory protein